MRSAVVLPADSADECSSFVPGSTLSSHVDMRTSRTSIPAASDRRPASLASSRRTTTTRVSTRFGTGDVAPSRPSGATAGASMKCSPCSETASSNSIQPRSGRLDASTVDVPTVTAHALIPAPSQCAAQEERELLAVPVPDQAQQRRPRGEHPRRRQRILADPADLLTGGDTGELHA